MDYVVTTIKSKKIRIYPTVKQRKIFRQWFGTSRKVYNNTVSYLKQPNTRASWKTIKGGLLSNLPEWAKEIPYQIKSVSVRDACIATSSAKRRCKSLGRFQNIKFKSKRNPVQSCYIPKSAISNNGIYHTLTGELRWTETLPDDFGDGRLICDNGRWFVTLPVQKQCTVPENQGRVVALDPGIRSFLSWFSQVDCGKFAHGDFGRIKRLCSALDVLISKRSKAHKQSKNSMKKAEQRTRWKIKDLVNELHHKAALWLVQNFDIILLPKYETQKMSNRTTRNINSKTARAMLTWSPYKFSQFLKFKAVEYGKTVVDVNEAWTSRTVSWTGEIVPKGGRKIIRSKMTGETMDRDINGARGIFLRALGDQPWLSSLDSLQFLSKSALVDSGRKK